MVISILNQHFFVFCLVQLFVFVTLHKRGSMPLILQEGQSNMFS